MKQNHGVELYRSWVNSSDFKNTQETFGTVPLQSAELAQAINDIDLDPLPQLTGELAYIARQCKTKLPVLPIISRRDAKRLFGKLVRKNKSEKLDFSANGT